MNSLNRLEGGGSTGLRGTSHVKRHDSAAGSKNACIFAAGDKAIFIKRHGQGELFPGQGRLHAGGQDYQIIGKSEFFATDGVLNLNAYLITFSLLDIGNLALDEVHFASGLGLVEEVHIAAGSTQVDIVDIGRQDRGSA